MEFPCLRTCDALDSLEQVCYNECVRSGGEVFVLQWADRPSFGRTSSDLTSDSQAEGVCHIRDRLAAAWKQTRNEKQTEMAQHRGL